MKDERATSDTKPEANLEQGAAGTELSDDQLAAIAGGQHGGHIGPPRAAEPTVPRAVEVTAAGAASAARMTGTGASASVANVAAESRVP